jgi:hypothetical protein
MNFQYYLFNINICGSEKIKYALHVIFLRTMELNLTLFSSSVNSKKSINELIEHLL